MNNLLMAQLSGSGFNWQALLPALVQRWWMLLLAAAIPLVLWMVVRRLLFRGKKKNSEAGSAPAVKNAASRATIPFVPRSKPRVEDLDPDTVPGAFGSWTDALAAQIPESETERTDFGRLLRGAGIYSPTARASIYAFRFVLMVFPLVVAGILASIESAERTWPILIGGAIVSGVLSIIPRLYVFGRRRHRVREIRAGLADMMDMLSMCLGGGLPLGPSLDHVAGNLGNYPALAEELRILRRQSEVGSLRHALADFGDRVDLPEVRQVASLLIRGEQMGTQLSATLMEQSDHFRSTRRQMATMQANKTPVKLTLPLMFCFAPAALILLMSPALLELREFLDPANGQSVLSSNEVLNAGQLTRAISELDQDFSSNSALTQ